MRKLLEIKNLSKTYHNLNGETKAIDNISFDVYDGDFISIVGPSGCGKSSILNILSNIDNNYVGIINKNNNIKIGYMFQNDTLFEWLTILDNSLLGLKISKKMTKDDTNYVLHLLEKYNLINFKDKYPSDLSGGMKQRVALIRTLAIKPDILLLDEPFSALDSQTKIKVSNDVYKIIKNENKTVIMVTHDISEAISMSNKIIVLSNRPSKIKNIYDINLINKSDPFNNRRTKEFNYYYDLVWKEIDKNE